MTGIIGQTQGVSNASRPVIIEKIKNGIIPLDFAFSRSAFCWLTGAASFESDVEVSVRLSEETSADGWTYSAGCSGIELSASDFSGRGSPG